MSVNNNDVTPKLKRCNAVHHIGTITKEEIDQKLSETDTEDEMAILISEMEREAEYETLTQTTNFQNKWKNKF